MCGSNNKEKGNLNHSFSGNVSDSCKACKSINLSALPEFSEDQITDAYFVYEPQGIQGETDAGKIDYPCGTKITLSRGFQASLDDTSRNAFGYVCEVSHDEQIVISSASLLHLPYPSRKCHTLLDYALHHLRLAEGVIPPQPPQADPSRHLGEKPLVDTVYWFEHAISVRIKEQPNWNLQRMTIPAFSAQDGFYLLNALGIIDLFEIFDGKIPNGTNQTKNLKLANFAAKAEVRSTRDGHLNYLFISPSNGRCGDWYRIIEETGQTSIEMATGCKPD